MFGHFGTISEFTGKKGRQTDRQSDREIETDGIVIPLLRCAQLCKFVCERAIKSVAASITFGVIHFWLSKQYLWMRPFLINWYNDLMTDIRFSSVIFLSMPCRSVCRNVLLSHVSSLFPRRGRYTQRCIQSLTRCLTRRPSPTSDTAATLLRPGCTFRDVVSLRWWPSNVRPTTSLSRHTSITRACLDSARIMSPSG